MTAASFEVAVGRRAIPYPPAAVVLFVGLSIIWGAPFLLTKVAVAEMDPLQVAAGRALVASAVLLPVALHRKVLRSSLRHWRWIVPFTLLEMIIPTWAVTTAQMKLSSALTALLISSVPLMAVLFGLFTGQRLKPRLMAGHVVGMFGILLLVGLDLQFTDWKSLAFILIAVLGYTLGPMIMSKKLSRASGVGVITWSMVIKAAVVTPIAALASEPTPVSTQALTALLALGVFCTALAFLMFFRLIRLVGVARATLVGYLNPVVAVVLGAAFLHESVSWGMALGMVMILGGSYVATLPTDEEKAAAAVVDLPQQPAEQLRAA